MHLICSISTQVVQHYTLSRSPLCFHFWIQDSSMANNHTYQRSTQLDIPSHILALCNEKSILARIFFFSSSCNRSKSSSCDKHLRRFRDISFTAISLKINVIISHISKCWVIFDLLTPDNYSVFILLPFSGLCINCYECFLAYSNRHSSTNHQRIWIRIMY